MSRTRIAVVVLLAAMSLPIRQASSQDYYSVVYEPDSGGLSLDFPNTLPNLTTLQLVSKSGIFTGQRPEALTGLFDVYVPDKLFKLDADGFGPIDFGPTTSSGLTSEFLTDDLCPSGSRAGGGALGDVRLATASGDIPFTGCDPPPADFNQYRLDYDSATGGFSFFVPDVLAPATTLQIESTSGVFTGTRPDTLPDQFDVFAPSKLFKLGPSGFRTTNFGPAVTPNLTDEFLASDLCVAGTPKTGGMFESVYLGGTQLATCDIGPPDPPPPPPPPAAPVALEYDDATGNLRVAVREDSTLSTFLINSSTHQFTGDRPSELAGQFDLFRSDRIFKMDVNGFHDVELGPVLPAGLSRAEASSYLCVAGTFLEGDDVGRVRLNGRRIPTCSEPEFDVFAPPPPPPTSGIHGVSLIYSPDTGDLLVISFDGAMTTLEVKSDSGLIQGERPPGLDGLFDVFSDGKIFKLDPAGFDTISLPGVLPPGLSFFDLANDLAIDGSLAAGGAFDGEITFSFFIPEPSSSALALIGALGAIALRRPRRNSISPIGGKSR